jgi:hypothetical protein
MMSIVVRLSRRNPPPLPIFATLSSLCKDPGEFGRRRRSGGDPRSCSFRPLEELVETTNRNWCAAREKAKGCG